MRIMWIAPLLMRDACIAAGLPEGVVGGWVQSQLSALLEAYGNANEYFILSLTSHKCDIQIGNVHHRSFGKGVVTYKKSVPIEVENEVVEAIDEFNPDIIHIHGTEFFYGRMRKDVYCNKPVVVSLQGILHGLHLQVGGFLSPNEIFWDQFNLRRFLYGTSILKTQTKWREERVSQENLVFKTHSHFMGRTEWDKAWMNALNPDATYHHVNETLRPEFYGAIRRNRAAIIPHSIYCSAAAGYPLKGVHFLFRAVALLKYKYPDITLRICAAERLTGPRTLMSMLKADQWTTYLRRIMKELGIERHIVGLPKLSAPEVLKELSKAELFVLPSLCENSPNSLGEAQLVGTPAIATFVGGIPSVLRDCIDGRLVPAADPAALSAMIDWFFSHPKEADEYALSARSAAIVRHDPKRNAEATMKTYVEVAGR